MTTITRVLSEAEWQALYDQRRRPCACAGDRPCLAQYGLLDNRDRVRARRGRRDRRLPRGVVLMADDQVRGEIVAALTRPAALPAGRVDALLDANDRERAVASRVLLTEAADVLTEAGILRRSASVLDAHHDQIQLLAAVYGLLVSWWAQPGYRDRPLGAMLKVVPADVAASAGQLLRWAGLLPPDPAEPEE
jgi:hypothetical protein